MKWLNSTYHKKKSGKVIGVADILDFGSEVWITRIYVEASSRGEGHASDILKVVIKEADAAGKSLVLQVKSSGGLNPKQLRAWYKRHGFQDQKDGTMRRPCEPAR